MRTKALLIVGAMIGVAALWFGAMSPTRSAAPSAIAAKAAVAPPVPAEVTKTEPVRPSVILDCKHPYIPSTVGSRLRYALKRAGAADNTTFEYRVEGVKEALTGLVVRWRLDARREGGSHVPPPVLTDRACDPEGAAEDPWFGANANLGQVSDTSRRWQWPLTLEPGQRIEGQVTIEGRDGEAMHIQRTHEVIGEEHVQVPAGDFRAWRVNFQEDTRVGERSFKQKGTAWLASGVGLVKLQADDELGAATQELVEYEIAEIL